jgi:glycogen operon protein
LFFAAGTPMMLGGDELGRTQKGNNNAYCQDNSISWFDWTLLKKNPELFRFFQQTIHTRKNYRLFRKRHLPYGDLQPPTITWYDANLAPLDWSKANPRLACALLHAPEPGTDNLFFFVIFNSDCTTQKIKLPTLLPPAQKNHPHRPLHRMTSGWHRFIDTSLLPPHDFINLNDKIVSLNPPDHYLANPRSVVGLVHR